MSKGFLRVSYFIKLLQCTDGSFIEDFEDICDWSYVSKKNVCHIEKITTFDQASTIFTPFCSEQDCISWWLDLIIASMYGKEHFQCTCGNYSEDKFNNLEQNYARKYYERNNVCLCWDQHFPIYVITAVNKHQKFKNEETKLMYTPSTVMYILHPEEHEHIERFISGTDSPMYDYVHHLKFGPGGTEAATAKADFESVLKKRKADE